MAVRTSGTKYVFVTGGVTSALGKGLTAAGVGHLLIARGLRVTMQKLDPYLNVDPATMDPRHHGEVFVTEDGTETDLDIGRYERFLDRDLSGRANVTTGEVYAAVIARERRGEYLGDTVQVIPHITDEIKHRITAMSRPPDDGPAPDVVITEIGGTVGDIESLPFLEAARQLRHEVGRDDVFFLHVALMPYLAPSGELKTKPTQHSVAALRNIGIQPDAIVCRADRDISDTLKHKIALMCDTDAEAVIAGPDAPSIYDIPKMLHCEGLDAYLVRRLALAFHDVDWTVWGDLLVRVHHPDEVVRIGLVGSDVERPDAYLSLTEALRAGGFAHRARVDLTWVAADECRGEAGAAQALSGLRGIVVTGGFGVRCVEGRIGALRHARTHRIPALGLGLGLQCMMIEAARSLAGIAGAHSAEFDPDTTDPVISAVAGRDDAADGDGGLRLGAHPAVLTEGSVAALAYGSLRISERHRHRYAVNNAYRQRLTAAGVRISGTSPGGDLVEFAELPTDVHPFYVGTQAHPELKSRPTRPHPLFTAFVRAALDHIVPEQTLPGPS